MADDNYMSYGDFLRAVGIEPSPDVFKVWLWLYLIPGSFKRIREIADAKARD